MTKHLITRTFIVLCGGNSARFMHGNKIFTKLPNHKTSIENILNSLNEINEFDKIIIVVNNEKIAFILAMLANYPNIKHKIIYANPGLTRFKSVENAIAHIEEGYIFIHDGARPYLDKKVIYNILKLIPHEPAVVPMLPIIDTLKEKNSGQITTAHRENFFITQTPQCFLINFYKKIIQKVNSENNEDYVIYDDSQLWEKYFPKYKIKYIKGSEKSKKITFFDDIGKFHHYE